MRHILIYAFVFLALKSFGQTPELILDWAYGTGNTEHDAATAIVRDNSGFIYVTGYYSKEVDFNSGPIVNIQTATYDIFGDPTSDMFICKYDSLGSLIWAKSLGSSGLTTPERMILTSQDRLVIGGNYRGHEDFDPGAGVYELQSDGSEDYYNHDIFLLCLDTAGNFIWANSYGSEKHDYDPAIVSDDFGNIYLCAPFIGTVSFNTGAVNETCTNSQIYVPRSFVLKVDADGNYVWVSFLLGDGSQILQSVNIRSDGNLILTGICDQDSDYHIGYYIDDLTNNFEQNLLLLCLDQNGMYLWSTTLPGPKTVARTIIDEDDYLYIVGNFEDTVDFYPYGPTGEVFAPYSEKVYILKLTDYGGFAWVNQFGDNAEIFDVELNEVGSVFASGRFSGIVDFDSGPAVFELNADPYQAGYITIYNNAGDFLNAVVFGDAIVDLVLDDSSNVYGCGFYVDSMDLIGISAPIDIDEYGMLDYMYFKFSGEGTLGLIDEGESMGDVLIYPNPFHDLVTVDLNSDESLLAYSIFSSTGSLLIESAQGTNLKNDLTIDLSELERGVYYVRFTIETGTSTVKVIKE